MINILNDIYFNSLTEREKIAVYARLNNSFISIEAIFSDLTENFVTPCEPSDNEPVTIKIRTGKRGIKKAYLVADGQKYEMSIVDENIKFRYYAYTFENIPELIRYYFEIESINSTYYYNNQGVASQVNNEFDFKVIPNFKTPEWSKSAVMYQIYVDRFANGDKTNDVVKNEYVYLGTPVKKLEWDKPVEVRDIGNHYGGDLQGILDKIPYLKDLGIEVIYLNPIFVSPSNHKYDAQDYDYIDPHYAKIVKDEGEPLQFEKFRNDYATKYISRTTDLANLEASNKFFEQFMKIAHENDIKVIIDGVFNHCGAFHKWLDREAFYEKNDYPVGAFNSKDSKYKDYFVWGNEADNAWPKNITYSSWWGHDNHPKLNFEGSEDLEQYILDIAKKWVSPPYNVDGWRLDVAADLGRSSEYNHKFWKKFRDVVKSSNKEAIIISEHYGDPSSWLEGDQWDTVMNYDAFMEPLTWFLTGMEKHSEDFQGHMLNNVYNFDQAMKYNVSKFSIQSLNTAMNQLSNHDHSRFLTRTNMTAGRLHSAGRELADMNISQDIMFEAIVIQMTWPGSPTLYYGDEVGVTGWTDPDNRRTFPWGKENFEIHSIYKKAIQIHKENEALKFGSLEPLKGEHGFIAYARWTKNNKILVVVNNTTGDKKVTIPVWTFAEDNSEFEVLMSTVNKCPKSIKAKNGFIDCVAPPRCAVILREKI